MKRLQKMKLRMLFVLFLFPIFQHGWAQQKKAVLPYRVVSNKMIVEVKINGKLCPLIFDTGGTMGIIDRVCDKLGLEGEGNITVTDVTGANLSFPKMHIRELRIPKGNVSFPDISVMKMVTPSPVERFGAVGLLGSDLWGHSIVHIDHKKQVIVITSAEDPVALDERYRVPFADKNKIWPVVPIQVGEHTIEAMFDSGAYGFLSLKEADYRNLYSWDMTQVVERGFGTGPSGVGGTYIPRMEPMKVGIATLEGVITEELTTAQKTLLGIRMLEYGKVTIDYSRLLFYFVPYQEESLVEQDFYNIAFALKNNELIVSKVWGDLKKVIKLGDKLVSINGKNAEKYDAQAILMKGIPSVTRKIKNELIILTKEGEKKVMYEKMIY